MLSLNQSNETNETPSVYLETDAASKYTVFPIKHHNLWKFYKKHLSTFWTVEEVLLDADIHCWENVLNEKERYFIKHVLAFFAASDGIVNENLVQNFYNDIELTEARQFYSVQMMIEAIHSEQYSILIDTFIQDSKEKNMLFRAIETVPVIKKKAEWALKWMDRSSFLKRLLGFICVEGIFFAGSFCSIYWLKNRGLMPGLSTSNEFISRDESLHTEFGIELYNMLPSSERLSEKEVHAIFKEAVEIEIEFVSESLPVSLIGMNSTQMTKYIKYISDRWLKKLGYSPIYKEANPFDFMEMISMSTKTNFFENRVAEYSRAGIGNTEKENTIGFDNDDF